MSTSMKPVTVTSEQLDLQTEVKQWVFTEAERLPNNKFTFTRPKLAQSNATRSGPVIGVTQTLIFKSESPFFLSFTHGRR
jgi:hypothetical protein